MFIIDLPAWIVLVFATILACGINIYVEHIPVEEPNDAHRRDNRSR